MKFILSLLLISSLFCSSSYASSTSDLKALVDDLKYSLTVEWDQKDQKFYEAKMNDFELSVEGLMKKGFTNADFKVYIQSEVKDANIRHDLLQALEVAKVQDMTKAELDNYFQTVLKSSYERGAAWDGSVVFIGFLAVAFVAVAYAFAQNFIKASKCPAGTTVETYTCSGTRPCQVTYVNPNCF
jgi:hypothetical protein